MITDRIIGALNGVFGDYLEEKGNPLSISMTLFYKGKAVVSLNNLPPQSSYKIVVFIHGLSDSEYRWEYAEGEIKTSFGDKLEGELGYIPLFLRYNTGLHISQNGEKLHQLIQDFTSENLHLLDEVVLVGHSMGGLVAHSAIQKAKSLDSTWESKLNKVFLLGSPLQGAPLERGANILSGIFKTLPQPYLKLASDLLNIRSNGIKDLRYGYTKQEEWEGHHPDEMFKNRKQKVEVHHDIEYYIVAGSIFSSKEQLLAGWLGDILVPMSSAVGYSKNKFFRYQFKEEHILMLSSISHLQLTTDPQVLTFIKNNVIQ